MASVRAAGPGRIEVAGDLLFDHAEAAAAAGRALVVAAGGQPVTVSLAGVGRANSAGAAVLIEWQRAAVAAGGSLQVVDVPPRVAGILRLSGLDSLLALR